MARTTEGRRLKDTGSAGVEPMAIATLPGVGGEAATVVVVVAVVAISRTGVLRPVV